MKADRPQDLWYPVDVWKCVKDNGLSWSTKKMPDEWRKRMLVTIYKNKGDTQSCTIYHQIKFMSQDQVYEPFYELWEGVI